MKIAILGAGISGISLFDILNKTCSNIDCDIYEKNNSIGGLCRTKIIDGYTYDLSGGHVFNTKYTDVKNYVFSILPENEWKYSRRYSKILYDNNHIIDYPFEFSLSELPVKTAVECIEGLYLRNSDNIEVTNFSEFLLKHFGNGIYNHYLKKYNEKIWKFDLNKMDFDWVNGKMPYPEVKQILTRTLSNETNESTMVHSSYYYPKIGGIQSLVNLMGKNISKTHIGEEINSIEILNKKVFVNGIKYDLVISTIPLPELAKKIKGIAPKIQNCITDLKYNSVKSYLYSTKKENEYSWMYIPNKNIIPHRIVYQGNFADEAAPIGKSSITVEITKPEIYTKSEILKNIEENLDLKKPIAEYTTKYAYVIFDKNRRKNMLQIKEYMNKCNILLHGRFAEWEYPNMDICIKKSIDLANDIIKLLKIKNI